MNKQALRKLYLSRRKSLSNVEVTDLSGQIFENLKLHFPALLQSRGVHLFLPIVSLKEVTTWPIVHWLWEHQVPVWVPKVDGEQLLNLPLGPATPLMTSNWGIPEPLTPKILPDCTADTVLCPLVYCDTTGQRIGYGKGFYDKLFVSLPGVKKIGLNYFGPNEKIEDVSETDVPLDYLVTPTDVESFGS